LVVSLEEEGVDHWACRGVKRRKEDEYRSCLNEEGNGRVQNDQNASMLNPKWVKLS
jgi:hypothetical protein